MTPETVQRVFQVADIILNELTNENKTTFKIMAVRIAEQTGLSISVITPLIQTYVKNRDEFSIKRGRTGGIRLKSAIQSSKAARTNSSDLPTCGDCGQAVRS